MPQIGRQVSATDIQQHDAHPVLQSFNPVVQGKRLRRGDRLYSGVLLPDHPFARSSRRSWGTRPGTVRLPASVQETAPIRGPLVFSAPPPSGGWTPAGRVANRWVNFTHQSSPHVRRRTFARLLAAVLANLPATEWHALIRGVRIVESLFLSSVRGDRPWSDGFPVRPVVLTRPAQCGRSSTTQEPGRIPY